MVRRKRNYKKRSRRSRVPGWGGAVGRLAGVGMKYASKGGMAYKALKLARKVADAVNVEYKIYDTVTTATAQDQSGALGILNNPAQGLADNQRIGDSLKVQNLTMRYYINAVVNCLFRVMIIWDPVNKTTSTGDILELVANANAPQSPKKYDNRFQTRVLYDHVHRLDTAAGLSANCDLVIPINEHTQFNAATTTIQSGALKVLFISSQVTTNVPTIAYYARVSYTDD